MSVTKVKRYWPGKAPEWADGAFPVMTDIQISRKDDPRLRRLAESRLIDRAAVRAEHRRIRQEEIISTEEEEESQGLEGAEAEEDGEDAMEDRRRRIREKLVQREEEKEEETAESESETDSESEYETDSDMVKPAVLFVPKSERDIVSEREQMEAEEMALEAAVRRRLEERKVETKQIVVEKIREEQEMNQNKEAAAEQEDVETDDELNEAEEYERWKAREIGRMMMIKKRDMGATESIAEDEPKQKQKKKRRRFLQKYYHKGALFQSHADDQTSGIAADTIYTRDFSSPTGEDKMDKTILPKVMQVKQFGRSEVDSPS